MKDLSNLAEGSMWVTAQEGGNRASARPDSMSAPGSEPAVPVPQARDRTAPDVIVTSYDPKNKVHVVNDAGGGQIPDSNTARPTLFTQDDGSGWKRC